MGATTGGYPMIGMEGRSNPPYEISINEKLIYFFSFLLIISIMCFVGMMIYNAVNLKKNEYVYVRKIVINKTIVEEDINTSGIMPIGKMWIITNGTRHDINHVLVLNDETNKVVSEEEYNLYEIGDPIIIKKKKE